MFIAKIEYSDLNAMIGFVERATEHWPQARRKALVDDLLAVIEHGDAIDLEMTPHAIEATVNQRFFDALRRHGLIDAAVM